MKIGQIRNVKPQGLCVVCGEVKADCRVDVEINNFRGDDDVYKVHKKCISKFKNGNYKK